MPYAPKDLTGSFFDNDRRREGKNDPHYTGSAMIGGQEFWMDVWYKEPDQKKPFYSVSFRPKDQQRQQERPQQQMPRRPSPPPPPRPPSAPDPDWPDVERQ